ncbi:hypothetical protein COH20_007585 [Aspergillus flavus]|nr:hypothetical protein COH20_007585 [Aspergillus flavus]RAQ80123.1 hypothetical protein COH21_004182 [Aspergillus flavus]
MGYWGGILLTGILHRLWTLSRHVQGGSGRGDVERKREQQLPDKAGIRDRLSFYWKAYIAVPAALGSYHQRRLLGCSIPNRPEILVVVWFWIMCIILNFGFHDIFIPNVTMPTISRQAWKYVAQRTSMFAYACLPWVWLFAGRNNIFIWATGWSFSTFNVFHRHLSRLTAIFAFVHAISYTVLDTIYGPYYEEGLHVLWFKFGIIGATMMGLLCGLSIPYIRTKCYELFLVGHILFAVILLVALFQHTSVFGTKYNAYLWPVVAIWCCDRFLRLVRLVYCNIRVSTPGHLQTTTAMVTYSEEADVVRLDVQADGSIRPLPGHYFHLYQLFSWRGWENHPFTVGAYTAPNPTSPLTSSSNAQQGPHYMTGALNEKNPFTSTPTEVFTQGSQSSTTDPALGNLVFWIRPYNGWTKRLKDQCLRSSSSDDSAVNGYYQTSIPISLEGPYGHTLPLHHYGTVVMIVGGTGIATAVPYIHDHVSRLSKAGSRVSDDTKTQTSNLTLVWACRGHVFMQQLCGRELAGALEIEGFTGRFHCTKGCNSHCAADNKNGELRIERGRPNIENIIHGAATEAQIARHKMAVLTCGSPHMSDEGIDVTAFRDPYVFQNKDLDDTVGSSSGTWYAAISGGVHDVGPGVFLYRNQGSGYEDWEYLGKWWSEPVNSTCGNGDWAKAWGYNFEVGNVFSLDKEGYNVNGETFITLGVEGSYGPITESVTSMHGMLWASGNILKPDGGNVTFEPTMAGVLDWGISSYAAAGKVLPATSQASEKSGAPDRFISYVWLTGDVFGGVAGYPSEQQGWQNTLLLPRELHKQTISNVVDNDLASETGSWCVKDSENSCLKLETMGIKIARETYKAMTNKTSFTEPKRTFCEDGAVPFKQSPTTKFFVLNAQLSFPKSARDPGVQAGFKILSSELESTTIYYQFSNESIVIGRRRLRLFDINKNCNKSDDDDKQEERKKKDAYREHGRNRHNVKLAAEDESHIETLDLTIVVDNAVLEVYANSRFALSTWARTWYANSTEISFFHNGEGEVTFSDISVSDGLYDAYPDRAR